MNTKRVSKPANKTKIPAANAVAFNGVHLLNRSQMSIPIAERRKMGHSGGLPAVDENLGPDGE